MDETLRCLQRSFAGSPHDIELAQQYIRALERVVGISAIDNNTHFNAFEHADHAATLVELTIKEWGRQHSRETQHIWAAATFPNILGTTEQDKSQQPIIVINHSQYDAAFSTMMVGLGSRLGNLSDDNYLSLVGRSGFCEQCRFKIESREYDAHACGW